MFVNPAARCEFELIPAVLLKPCLKDCHHPGMEKHARAKSANMIRVFLTLCGKNKPRTGGTFAAAA